MTHGRLGRPRPGGVEHGRRCIFVGIAPHFRLERALAGPPLHMASEGASCRRSFAGESAQNLGRSGSRRSYMGKVAPALVDRGRGGRSSQMAGNGTYAASRMEIDYVPIRSPVSGANWRRTNYMRTSKRAGSLRTGPDQGWGRSETGMGRALSASNRNCAPLFRRNGAKRGMRRASRGLGEGGRTGARGPKCAYVRFPARRGPWTCNPKLDSS